MSKFHSTVSKEGLMSCSWSRAALQLLNVHQPLIWTSRAGALIQAARCLKEPCAAPLCKGIRYIDYNLIFFFVFSTKLSFSSQWGDVGDIYQYVTDSICDHHRNPFYSAWHMSDMKCRNCVFLLFTEQKRPQMYMRMFLTIFSPHLVCTAACCSCVTIIQSV